jgi:5'-nucleotidase
VRILAAPAALLAATLAGGTAAAQVVGATDPVVERLQTAAAVEWRAPVSATDPVEIRLVGLNDLHGYLETAAELPGATGPRPVGGAAVLAAYLGHERLTRDKRTLTLIAGDSIGASPPVSGFLRDEPTLAVLNRLADGDCPPLTRAWPATPSPVVTRCRTLAAPGNHEFDRGVGEFERLLYGGRAPAGGLGAGDWRGTALPWLVANVVRRDARTPLLPGSAIVEVAGVRVGVIGAVTVETAALVPATRLAEVQFLPEAPAINAELAKLKAAGVGTIALVIHEGLRAPVTPQTAALSPDEISGRLRDVIAALDPGIDVIVSGHTHKLTNVLVATGRGAPILVTQAREYGTAFATIDLTVNRSTGKVVAKGARVLTTWADEGPGLKPDRKVRGIVEAAKKLTGPLESRVVGTAAAPLVRARDASGESPLGELVADAFRAAAGAELAFVNAGGLRNDLGQGPVTYGQLYAALPFGNRVMRVTMSGEQVLDLLEQQWSGPNAGTGRTLYPSGLRYSYDLRRPAGRRLVDASDDEGLPIDPKRRYVVATSDYLLGGGDHFAAFAAAGEATSGVLDREAVERWLAAHGGAAPARVDGRLRRLDVPR